MTAELIASLRAQVEALESGPRRESVPTHPLLDGLLTLRAGGVYTVTARTLAMLLMVGPSADGAWTALVGAPEFGVQAAHEFGIDVSRLVAVPEPSGDILAVIGALVDVADVLVLSPVRLTGADTARLVARLRERRCVLITWGAWSRADAHLDWTNVTWHGLGAGHGYLQARRATLEVRVRDRVVGRREVWLPDHDLQFRPARELRSVG